MQKAKTMKRNLQKAVLMTLRAYSKGWPNQPSEADFV